MAKTRRKSSVQAAIASPMAMRTTRMYIAPLVALTGISSLITMSLLAPTLNTPAPVNLITQYKYSLLTHHQMNDAEASARQLVVRNGGFSFNRLFTLSRRSPQHNGGAESSMWKSGNAALTLYMVVPTLLASFILVSVIWKLLSNKKNATRKTDANNKENFYSHEIFLHDNALFSQTELSSFPPTPPLEERSGATPALVEKTEEHEEIIALFTPPRLPEQPTSYITPTTSTTTTAIEKEEAEESHSTGNTAALGSRAYLKLASSHSPSARAPTHKVFKVETPAANRTIDDKTTIENDAFVPGNYSDVYSAIDNTGIWEAAPLRIEPTLATVLAVAGEDGDNADGGLDTDNGHKQAAELNKKTQKKSQWKVEDLKKELKATQDIVAALKIELLKGEK